MTDDKKKMDEMLKNAVDSEDDFITLTDEDGLERTLEVLGELQIPDDDNWYLIMAPVELMDDETEDTVYVFRSILDESSEDDEVFEPVTDEELIDKIFAEYDRLCDEEEGL